MTTERYTWLTTLPTNLASVQARPALELCSCGQDLDQWSRSHCPRCGTPITGSHQAA